MDKQQVKLHEKMFWELLLIGIVLITGGIYSLVSWRGTYGIIMMSLGIVTLITGLALLIRFIRMRIKYGRGSYFLLILAILFFMVVFLFVMGLVSNILLGLIFMAYAFFTIVSAFSLRLFNRGLFWTILMLGLLLFIGGLLIIGLNIALKPEMIGIYLATVIGVTMLVNGFVFILLAAGNRLSERKNIKGVPTETRN